MQDFKKLKVYQEDYDLSKEFYKELKDVKGNFRLKEQLFGSTKAVCANLAEMSAFKNKNAQKQHMMLFNLHKSIKKEMSQNV